MIQYENESEDGLKYSLVRCSTHKLNSTGLAYILENGFYILILITTAGCTNVKFLNAVFGPNVDSALKIPIETVRILFEINYFDIFNYFSRACLIF